VALEGTLKDFSLADIFQLIGLQRKTGVLTLKGKDDVVTISFLDGKVVSADSLQKKLENRLGRVMVKTGRITNEQLEKALQIQRNTLQRLGTILVQNAIVAHEELREALQVQVLQTIYRLFRWKDGDYQFSQESSIEYDRDYVTPITAESILMEGARMIDEWPIIERKIRSYEVVYRKTPIRQVIEVAEAEDDEDEVDFDFGPGEATMAGKATAVAHPHAIKISRAEGAIYELIDGRNSVAEIVERSRYHEFDTVKAIYELLSRGLVEEAKEIETEDGSTIVMPDAEPKTQIAGPLVLLGLVALLIVSLVAMVYNPANLALRPEKPGGARKIQNQVRRSVSIGRLERIAAASEIYMLLNGTYPLNLPQLADLGLLDPSEAVDPWGRKYGFVNKDEKVLIDGRPPNGQQDFRLIITKTIHRSREMPDSTEGAGAGRSVVLVD
jgi:hypothetical protein